MHDDTLVHMHIYIYIYIERERERERGVHTHLYICIDLESTGAAPGLLQPHPTCMDAACGGQHRWPLVCAMPPFFFFVCGFAPIRVEFDCIGRNLPKHAEKGRIRLKPALNHSEILVKKKKMQNSPFWTLKLFAFCLSHYLTLRLPSLTP